MEGIDVSKYTHSPVHRAVASRDHATLRSILSSLPKPRDPSEIQSESDSLSEEATSDAISSVIDRRDVPRRDTPLHLAVKLCDATSAEMLMVAGADWTLQNEDGWNALQEAVCSRQESIAMIIVRHYQPLAWAKWCRRLPRLVATMRKMKDFYLEMSFHFESSVVPFVSKVAPSDTYKVWKVGSNLRADMTMAGFDGFKIQRSDQSILFLGDGSEDGKVPRGSLYMVNHKDKEVMNALDGASSVASDEDVKKEVAAMCRSNIFRPGIDVTQAVLNPQTNWRRQEKSEMVGPWRAKVYEMNNVVVSIKSRKVPGSSGDKENGGGGGDDELCDVLTDEEQKQLEAALKLDLPEFPNVDSENGFVEAPCVDSSPSHKKQEKKGWLGGWRKKEATMIKQEKEIKYAPPRSSLCVNEKVSNLLGDTNQIKPGRHSVDNDHIRKPRVSSKSHQESEYKKGLRPVLWLSTNFPLQTEELLPLLDILANKVKAIRRLRELLTTKLPAGTFPVKVAIPVVPTIKVLVTFTKFEEVDPADEFKTPPSSPTATCGYESPADFTNNASSSSWFRRARSNKDGSSRKSQTMQDPFAIPAGYTWGSRVEPVYSNLSIYVIKAANTMNRVLARQLRTNLCGSKHIFQRACSTHVTRKVSSTAGSNETNANSTGDSPQHDIAIVGGGMVGIALAASLASKPLTKHLNVAIIDNNPLLGRKNIIEKGHLPDPRVSTVTPATISFLKDIGAWKYIEEQRHAYFDKMQVWDYTGLGYTRYNAKDVDQDILGCVVENKVLQSSQLSCVQESDLQKTIYPARLNAMGMLPSSSLTGLGEVPSTADLFMRGRLAKLELSDGNNVYAKLVVGADGSKSRVRELAGIKTTGWNYSQNAIICTVEHTVENFTAWQRFLPNGPIALLPVGDKFSNIVWTMDPTEASDRKSMSEDDFIKAVNDALDYGYGPHPETTSSGGSSLSWLTGDVNISAKERFETPPKVVKLSSERMVFPLSLRHAKDYVSNRVALVGDSAHTVHPLAGQGVNLGFADASALSRAIAEGIALGTDIGEANLLKRYEAERKPANIAMMAVLDGIQKMYAVNFGPLNAFRAAAFHGAHYISPLKKRIISYASGEQSLPLFS
uniref:Ubiquinone biosynthesis monooxygenase COQ6, mitochondrial n=2 Tax=Brassica campestris TaxID=3711 RepID=M4DET1_BRACM